MKRKKVRELSQFLFPLLDISNRNSTATEILKISFSQSLFFFAASQFRLPDSRHENERDAGAKCCPESHLSKPEKKKAQQRERAEKIVKLWNFLAFKFNWKYFSLHFSTFSHCCCCCGTRDERWRARTSERSETTVEFKFNGIHSSGVDEVEKQLCSQS